MEGVAVLITDFEEVACKDLMEFLITKNAIPYVLVKDFESIGNVYESNPSSIPIVLDFHRSVESTVDHILALPAMSCIFNFDDKEFETLYLQNFERCHKTFTTSKDNFNEMELYNEISEAISQGYTLIVNFLPPAPSPSGETLQVNADSGSIIATTNTTNPALNSSRNLKFIYEKFFTRHPDVLKGQKLKLTRRTVKSRRFAGRESNPIRDLFIKVFAKFNPCCTVPVLNFLPSRSRSTPIKSPEEINMYIKTQETNEIQIAFQTIHESALRNWTLLYVESFQASPQEIEERLILVREEIESKGEKGRQVLLENISKQIDQMKQWGHVLGVNTIDKLRITKEKEIEKKVQIFCNRKLAEAKQKIQEEIQENQNRAKARFYGEILDEQVMELVRIKAKYQKRKELLMLPYTGELKLLN